MRKIFNTPEFILIGLGIFWITERYLASGRMSYITMLVTWLIFLQIIYKNRICGMIYGAGLGAISIYKLYTSFINAEHIALFDIVKLATVFWLTLIMSISMLYKYARTKESYGESVLTASY